MMRQAAWDSEAEDAKAVEQDMFLQQWSVVSKNAWLDDLDEYYSAKWCQDQFGKRVAVLAPGEAMIGPGAGGCGMAALFKVLDPLGKARPEATKKQHVRKNYWDVQQVCG